MRLGTLLAVAGCSALLAGVAGAADADPGRDDCRDGCAARHYVPVERGCEGWHEVPVVHEYEVRHYVPVERGCDERHWGSDECGWEHGRYEAYRDWREARLEAERREAERRAYQAHLERAYAHWLAFHPYSTHRERVQERTRLGCDR